MRSGISIKTIVLILIAVMIGSFTIALGMLNSSTNLNFFGLNNNTYNVNEEVSFEMGETTEINYQGGLPRVKIISTEGDTIKVHYYGSVVAASGEIVPVMEVNTMGTTLDISVQRRSHITTGVSRNELKLDIYLPEKYDNNLRITTSSGRISIDELELNEIVLTTSSGEINANRLKADDITMQTSSGRINVNSVEANNFRQQSSSGSVNIGSIDSETVYLQTSSGRINIDNVKASTVQHRASSGEIRVQSTEVESGTYSSSSGKINLYNYQGDLTVASSSGDITVEYLEFDNDIDIAASSGKVNLKLPRDSEFYARLTTSSGKMSVDFPLEIREESRRVLRGVVGSDRNNVYVTTSSGKISVTN